MKQKAFRTNVAKAVSIGILGLAAIGLNAPTATASGSSGKVNNCWSGWGSTSFWGKCERAAVAGDYQVHADCNNEPDIWTGWYYLYKGYIGQWTTGACIFKVNSGKVLYTN
ncbi:MULTISPECIES: hypothetical protein [Streptomyces]|uniref:Uncharacterized protein n=1 Tax=Streptomyces chartreusis NRRL 3882 TaxID=1079985 RepID=A0A2N9B9U4_STRCX|nr:MULTISPECIES: hypothetical protein [Streptomyces]MYS93813.1 hypothetical protein [Streptomyces sp. SID5464]SOR80127.1 hypothetical protein SCNRRL3882_3583 [Streptomyces chartreusis NRRL 3882]